jgi:F0F1-type ATP synthase assembly protein I
MVWDILNSLRGLVFQKIKHSVFLVLVMFSFHVFLTTGREFLKTKRGFYQGHVQKKNLSQLLHKIYYLVFTGVTLIPIFHKFSRS